MERSVEFCKIIEAEMYSALENGEFQVFLQPKINMNTSKVYGAEALSRWVHPVEGIRRPDEYIPIFEESGFIVRLDMYIFEEVCKMKKRWHEEKAEYANIPVSVNMSRLHLYRTDFVGMLLSITKKYGIRPSELELEITESVYLNDFTEMINIVDQLHEVGFGVSIDDFGSGYSALNMLKDIPVDTIKIDKEFLQLSTNSARGKKVIKNIIILCKDLKLNVMVEGVEEKEQIDFLTSYGCEIAQGFYYSCPIPVHSFEKYATEHYVVSLDAVKFSFRDNFISDDGRFSAEVIGNEHYFTKGIATDIRAVHFGGGEVMENYMLLPPSVIHNDSYSVSMWMKADELTLWTAIVFGEYENGFFQFCPLAADDTACYRIRDRRQVDGWFDTSTAHLDPNVWYHIVITYDRYDEKSYLYINGKLIGEKEEVPALYFLKRLMVGGDIYKKSFKGYICEVIFYDSALSARDILELHEEYKTADGFCAFPQ